MTSPVAPTRVRILTVAADLFGTRGVDAVSLDEIAAAVARLPPRTRSTNSQAGTQRSRRSTSAVPTNPVAPVMAMRVSASASAIIAYRF